jgi:hypothetical protein
MPHSGAHTRPIAGKSGREVEREGGEQCGLPQHPALPSPRALSVAAPLQRLRGVTMTGWDLEELARLLALIWRAGDDAVVGVVCDGYAAFVTFASFVGTKSAGTSGCSCGASSS